MGRRASREMAMKLLYQLDIQKEDTEGQIKVFFDENPFEENDRKYILDVVNGVLDNTMEIDQIIEKYAKGWKISRMSKIDLSILRLSTFEIKYRNDIPFNVSINEAVELAKRYSGQDAGAFINGVLSNIPKIKAISKNDSEENI